MKKKQISKREIVIIIVIVAIILAIIIPIIVKSFKDNEKNGQEIESMLVDNLESYNKKYEKDLWCGDDSASDTCSSSGELIISFDELLNLNKDIDLGQCLLEDDSSLSITRGINGDYTYNARIVCCKDFKDKDYNIATLEDMRNENISYQTSK